MKRFIVKLALLLFLPLVVIACATARNGYIPPAKHPPIYEMGERRVYCVRCHGYGKEKVDFEKYNHTVFFTDSHRLAAYQDERVCAMCHETSFCNICHIVPSSELKPSLQYPTENHRRFQHRGDYISRHRIEARVDPSSCFRCHGNPRSSQTCRPCHG
jgi:hypothetical protein